MAAQQRTQRRKVFLMAFVISFGLIFLIWLYQSLDIGAIFIFLIFAFVSITSGFISGLASGLLINKTSYESGPSKKRVLYWSISGAFLGLDVFIAIAILFFMVGGYASTLGLAIIPFGMLLLLLLATPAALVVFSVLPAFIVLITATYTENRSLSTIHVNNGHTSTDGRFILGVIIITLAMCNISWFGILIYEEAYKGDVEHDTLYYEAVWRKLPKPPNEVKRLLAAFPFAVYIEAINGDILGCRRPTKYDEDCWFPVDHIPEPLNLPCEDKYPSSPDDRPVDVVGLAPTLPSAISITQSISIEYCDFVGRDISSSGFQYILDSDGEVWQWGFDYLNLASTPGLDKILRNIYSSGIVFCTILWLIGIILLGKWLIH